MRLLLLSCRFLFLGKPRLKQDSKLVLVGMNASKFIVSTRLVIAFCFLCSSNFIVLQQIWWTAKAPLSLQTVWNGL